MLVTLEGPDGAGKTTVARLLAEALEERDPLLVREPGGTAFGERVRDLVLRTAGTAEIGAQAEAYLFMAARAELLEEVVSPALAAGRLVLSDRYHDSTRVYQGAVGGAEVPWPAVFPFPALTVLVLVPAEVGLRRQAAGRAADRIEGRPLAFHQAVHDAYLALAVAEPDRWLVVDGERPPAETASLVAERVQERLSR
jgi:dTMP kinase